MSRLRLILGVASACAAVLVAVTLWRGLPFSAASPPSAATTFLDRYVGPEGRVQRFDQGGDTVSEGQAYAMLLAAANGRERTFARVWHWTHVNLQRPDGLLAWHWRDGRVTGAGSAADADLDAAWALLLASEHFDRAGYRGAGLKLGAAILAHETVRIDGRPVLVAGDWATEEDPAVVNPSYFTPAAFSALGHASGSRRWEAVAISSRAILAQLTEHPSGLPPNWAVVEADGSARATPPPDAGPGAITEFGYDAVRVPLWMEGGCGPEARGLAARQAEFLADATGSPSQSYGLEGEPRGGPGGAPMLVAAAAASAAAGDEGRAGDLLQRAEDRDEAEATYYGDALVALARESIPPEGALSC